jgi:hypothetical protein
MDMERDRKGIGTLTRTGMGKGMRTGTGTGMGIQKRTVMFLQGIQPWGTTFESEYLSKFKTEFKNNLG